MGDRLLITEQLILISESGLRNKMLKARRFVLSLKVLKSVFRINELV